MMCKKLQLGTLRQFWFNIDTMLMRIKQWLVLMAPI